MEIYRIIPFLYEKKRNIKIHCSIGGANKLEPLYLFFKNEYKSWQEEQNNKNFERDFILSIIYMEKNEYLFAGIYQSIDVAEVKTGERKGKYLYNTLLTEHGKEFIGKLVIKFEKDFRNTYLLMENFINDLQILELKKQEYKFDPFPGYSNINIQFDLLKEIINSNEISWKIALSNIKGIYLISDTSNGKLYVGSAYGNNAFWQRWQEYIINGHGNNKIMKEIIMKHGIQYCTNFTFSILEIFNLNTMDDEIIRKESFWKDRLLTRKYGYNDN